MSALIDEENDQPTDVIFEIEGRNVPYGELDPETVRSWYESHTNMDNFTKSNTQKAQALADEKREFDAYKESHKQQLNEYNAWVNFFNQNPQAARDFEQLVSRHTGQPAQPVNQAQLPPEVVREIEELKKRVSQYDQRFQQSDQEREIEKAYKAVAENFKDFDKKAFDDYLYNKTGKLDALEGLYALVEKARRHDDMMAQQSKKQSGLESGETSSGSIEPHQAVEVSEGEDPVDAVFKQIAKERGIEDY